MIRHRLEITFGMDGYRLSIEPPAEFVLSAPDEGNAEVTTRTGGNLRTFTFSSNDFTMEEPSPLTGFIVEVESPDDVLKCSLEQNPANERRRNSLVGITDPGYAIKVCVDGKEPLVVAPSDQSPIDFEVPLT